MTVDLDMLEQEATEVRDVFRLLADGAPMLRASCNPGAVAERTLALIEEYRSLLTEVESLRTPALTPEESVEQVMREARRWIEAQRGEKRDE